MTLGRRRRSSTTPRARQQLQRTVDTVVAEYCFECAAQVGDP